MKEKQQCLLWDWISNKFK